MRPYLLALALAGLAVPALAMEPGMMSCADFVKLDEHGQMAALAPATDDAGGMMASSESAGGMMASSGDAGGMMASDDAGGMMAGDDDGHMAMMAADACAAHPDMTVGDAMKAN